MPNPSATFPYLINFENASTASAPAQQITITQTLDPNLDLHTFQLGSFGFDNMTFNVPANSTFYTQRLDLQSTLGIYVDVVAGINPSQNQAFWTFIAIDPTTGQPVTNPLVGILPPNNASNAGQGFVTYTINPIQTVTTGTQINAEATIVFDTEAPINTPQISNTIDAGKPTSTVNALPNQEATPSFTVNWTGNDDNGGSGLADFTLYVSDNVGDFTPWLTKTTLTSATYTGQAGHTYAFYSVATDNAGLTEAVPNQADTITTVVGIVNNAPTDLSLSANTINENVAANSVIGNFISTDPDTGNTFTYSLVSGADSTDNASFSIINSNQLSIIASPDYETKNSYSVRVRTADQDGLTYDKALIININNVNEAPTVTSGSSKLIGIYLSSYIP